jgi:NAD(P)-dependent dehydrogenase (short-subunit alcohol dehydrogenase family)
MSTPTKSAVGVFGPNHSALRDVIAKHLETTGLQVVGDHTDGNLDGAVFVAGSPVSYNIDGGDLGTYVGDVVDTVSTIAQALTSGPARSRSLVLVSPPLSDTLVAGASAISTVSGALVGLCRALVVELGDTGLRINVVQPGLMRDVSTAPLPTIPLERPEGKLTTPEDVAYAAHFLLSADSSYITGVQIDVDGGVSENRHAAASVLWSESLTSPDGPGLAALIT